MPDIALFLAASALLTIAPGPDVVYVFGKWRLSRAGEAPEKAPHGLFTLILERANGVWSVTRDHTSAAGG